MMRVKFNGNGTCLLDMPIRFNIQPDVFEEPIIVEAMRDIEHVYKIEGLAFYSSDFGVKSPESLSNGMKALILLTYAGMGRDIPLISNCCMGKNCSKYLCQLSTKYDFDIAWDYLMCFPHENIEVNAVNVDTGEVFKDSYSFDRHTLDSM